MRRAYIRKTEMDCNSKDKLCCDRPISMSYTEPCSYTSCSKLSFYQCTNNHTVTLTFPMVIFICTEPIIIILSLPPPVKE